MSNKTIFQDEWWFSSAFNLCKEFKKYVFQRKNNKENYSQLRNKVQMKILANQPMNVDINVTILGGNNNENKVSIMN